MGKMKACLAITAITLTIYGIVHTAGANPVRPGDNVAKAPVASAHRAAQDDEPKPDACGDTSQHTVQFITVAPGVELEVLDWGGTGEPLVLITGGGDNAHVYDNFAYQFTDRFHVIGITRRGFGRSTQTTDGYDLTTRVRDDIAVLNALNIPRANFIAHSIGGTELFKLGADYPNRVLKLVTLDGLDNASGGWSKLPQPPFPDPGDGREMESIQLLAADSVLSDGYRPPVSALCNMVHFDPDGRITGAVTPTEIGAKVTAGLTPADYQRIKAPVLGIFNRLSPNYRLPFYPDLTPAKQLQFRRSIAELSKWVDGAINRFRRGVRNGRVIELPDGNHYIYIVQESFAVREIRKFLLGK